MKKILCVFAFVFASGQILNAQIQKGNVMVGADLANLQLSLNRGGNFNVQINPKAAWFIRNNTALGAYLNFGLATAKGVGASVNYGVGALGRYYINDAELNLVRHSRFFFEGNVGIEGYNPTVGDNTNGLGIGVGPGLAYFITPNIGLEGLLKYNNIVGFGSAVSSSNLNLQVGFQIYLPYSRVRAAANNTQ
ncbi:hypothetical protein EXU57_16140 [Segetibacter sp. 3557_3]|uniref:hypothetical protein n=1 Tax=Segetibacter sp. 3557_3 TaxID=2547429 RepID=UPI00105877AF|nr:hypothetical protein [Segetibacter sp. 3557_3]TDH24016.1 hypothetical protein EXU57_16140 [Segetibacter sp. 3557_3]